MELYGEEGMHSHANSRLPNQTAMRIRKTLLKVVREGVLNSIEEMRDYLMKHEQIRRSESSIYRYVTAIKNNYPEFKDRNFVMKKKDVASLYYPTAKS